MTISIVGIIAYMFNTRQGTGPTQTSLNPTINIQNKSIDYTIPVLKDYDPSISGRNLWLFSSDGTKSKQITSNHEMGSIFGFSPDKKRVLVLIIRRLPAKEVQESNIGFVNLDNGQVTKLFPGNNKKHSVTQARWLDNDKIIYSLGKKLEIYNISTRATEVLVDTEETIDSTLIRFALSPNRQWLVYKYEGGGLGAPPQQDSNTYSLNLNNKTQTKLFTEGDFYTLNDSYIVFRPFERDSVSIRKINYDGSQDELITKVPPGLVQVSSTKLGDKLVYQLGNSSGESEGTQLYLYDVEKKQGSIFFAVKVPEGIRDPNFSEIGDTVLFYGLLDENHPLKYSLILYNLKSNTKTILGDDLFTTRTRD